ncbi:MAG: outer membrane beta-barrel protein [Helicobacteraceae bacterium]|jgi:opacity protein-like surface antigen|nr:outer membrane beta-barrel protein [Helicobacteraceae bacterium]
MKKLLAVVLAVFFASGALLADDGWQISAGAHMSKFKAEGESENNTPFSLAIGKEIMKSDSGNALLEFSLMTGEKYEESESEEYYGDSYSFNAKVEMKMAFFASLYYQFNVPSVAGLKPYLGAGLGLAFLKASISESYDISGYGSFSASDSFSDTVIAYQLGLGADYFFNKNIGAGLGYAMRDYGELKGSGDYYIVSAKMKSSGLFAKLTYRF